ncbi:hypothetical protein QYF36_010266 [Acer negundo]|nr:hypothetical protein QYF36_010266 [Acer negundo]
MEEQRGRIEAGAKVKRMQTTNAKSNSEGSRTATKNNTQGKTFNAQAVNQSAQQPVHNVHSYAMPTVHLEPPLPTVVLFLDYKFWTYNCADCNFNVHICCATGKTRKVVCQETEEKFDGDHQPAAMEHHGFHNQLSSGRSFVSPQSAFLAQSLAQANESINLLRTIDLQHTKF